MVQRHIHMLHDVNTPRVTINPNYSHRIEELIEMILGFPDHRELNITLSRAEDDVDQEVQYRYVSIQQRLSISHVCLAEISCSHLAA